MDFGDATPQVVPRFGSVVTYDNPVQLPLGLATSVRNCRYTAQSVATRWGFRRQLLIGPAGGTISGLGIMRYLAPDNTSTELINLLAYTAADGNIWTATPFVQGSVAQLSTAAMVSQANIPRVVGLAPQIAQGFNRGYIAQGDLTKGVAPVLVFDPQQGTLDPASDQPMGFAWQPNLAVRVGQVCSPSTFQTYGLPAALGTWIPKVTGYLYQCVTAGTTGGGQPVWPGTTGAIISDGSAVWAECTPYSENGLPDPAAPTNPTTTADANSPITPKATAYIVLTYVNENGESINDVATAQGGLDTSKVLQYVNTGNGPIDLTVTMPPIPQQAGTGGPLGANGATAYNAYAFISQGTPDASQYLDATYYAKFATNIAPGATVTLSAWPTGQGLPQVNTATVADPGNVDTGVRYLVWIFETRTQYQTGFTVSAPIRVNVTQTGLRLQNYRIPVGPYNCVRRIAGITVAGASAAGPYFYIDQDDVQSPGFNQPDVPITATALNDNATTAAEFNFTDTYLPGASEITNYLQRVPLPPASDVYFSRALQRNIYTGCIGFPSGHLVSDENGDLEAVRVPGSNLQVAEANGDRTVCWREIRDVQISCKENSGYGIIPNDGDPSNWGTTPQPLWTGTGPVGPKAIASGIADDSEFLVWAHRTGPYRYVGGVPLYVGREIETLWERINWAVGYKIQVSIDELRREVRFAVPMDGSTQINKVLTMNYYFGWGEPVVFVERKGVLVPNVEGRKWSLDDVAPGAMAYVPQRQQVTPGAASLDAQFLVAGQDGALYTLAPGQYFDHNAVAVGVGYYSGWQSVPGPNQRGVENDLMGATCAAIGSGPINVYALDDRGNKYALSTPARTWTLGALETVRDFGAVATHASRFGIGFDNGMVPGNWFEMHVANLYVVPTFGSRLG